MRALLEVLAYLYEYIVLIVRCMLFALTRCHLRRVVPQDLVQSVPLDTVLELWHQPDWCADVRLALVNANSDQ